MDGGENLNDEISKLYTYLKYDKKESNLYIPNEIFDDLKSSGLKGSSHIAFAYSYYYLISWLYRYCKYENVNVKVEDIKGILGYSPSNRDVNYIIKKNGILDQMGYTISSTDYPYLWDWNDGDIEFSMVSELDNDTRQLMQNDKGRNYKIKIPIKGLWRSRESETDGCYDGTFYEIENTHEVKFEEFAKCMNSEIGVIGFYLYAFIKSRCQWHDGKYNSSTERIAEDSGLSVATVERYIGKLLMNGMISYGEGECKKIDGEFRKGANTYRIGCKIKNVWY